MQSLGLPLLSLFSWQQWPTKRPRKKGILDETDPFKQSTRFLISDSMQEISAESSFNNLQNDENDDQTFRGSLPDHDDTKSPCKI